MNEKITLMMPDWQYKKILEKIELVKKGLRMVKINDSLKTVIMNDVYAIDGIIKQSKKGAL